jgi:putative restriction endonuclease
VPGVPFRQLVDTFVTTLERDGATVLLADDLSRRPARVRVVFGDEAADCLLFLWTITPGGGGPGVRPRGERRIQITNVEHFPLSPGTRTIVGGYAPEEDTWAFWDARRHSRFSRRSPSLQTTLDNLQAANHHGLATQLRTTDQGREVIVAVRSDALLWYVLKGQPLHNVDTDNDAVTDLLVADVESERALIDESDSPEQAARRHELVQTMRAFRDARFRPAVLRAYSYRCAVSGVALKLVDAAHIVPVNHPEGTDEVTNGLALSRLHHAAYDSGLLGIRPDYTIVLNPKAIRRLKDARLLTGLEAFKASLPQRIRVPSSLEVRPDPAKLRIGMQVRQFPGKMIS